MRANRLKSVWLEQREAAQGVERQGNVKGRSTDRRLLEITVVSGQSCEVTSYGKLQYTDWSILHPASTVTHPAIPITHKHWASECDRQEQRGDAAVTAVSQFRQKHVCKGCSPVTNSEACLHPRSFIHHQQHVANNHKNASYLPRHRDFSCLSLEPGTAITVPDSSCVLHTAQYLWVSHRGGICCGPVHLGTANTSAARHDLGRLTLVWYQTDWWQTEPCCLHHNVTPKDEHRHWKGLISNHAKDTQEAVIQSWCMLSSICIHTVNRKAYNQVLLLCFLLFICSTATLCHPQKSPGFHCARRCTNTEWKRWLLSTNTSHLTARWNVTIHI